MSRWLIGMLIFLIGLFWSSPTAMPDVDSPANHAWVYMRVMDTEELPPGYEWGAELSASVIVGQCYYGGQTRYLLTDLSDPVWVPGTDFPICLTQYAYGENGYVFMWTRDLYGWVGPPQEPVYGKHVMGRFLCATKGENPALDVDILTLPWNAIAGFDNDCEGGPIYVLPLAIQRSDGSWLVQPVGGDERDGPFIDQIPA